MLALSEHGAGEGEHGDLYVGIRAELTGGDAAAEHRPDQVAPRFHYLLFVAPDQPGIALPLPVQQRELSES